MKNEDKKVKEFLEKNYDVFLKEDRIYIKPKFVETAKKKMISPTKNYVMYLFSEYPNGQEPDDYKEIEKLIEEGKAMYTFPKTLYQLYFGWDENEWLIKSKGYDLKTKEYFNKVKNDIRFIKKRVYCKGEKFEEITTYNIHLGYLGETEVRVGKRGGLYIAEYKRKGNRKGVLFIDLYFFRKPSVEDIIIAECMYYLDKLYFPIFNEEHIYKYHCSKCGQEIHWVDNKGETLLEKYKMLTKNHCGC